MPLFPRVSQLIGNGMGDRVLTWLAIAVVVCGLMVAAYLLAGLDGLLP